MKSNEYQEAANNLILGFLEERNLLTADLRTMIERKDVQGLQQWTQATKDTTVKVPMEVFIGGLQVNESIRMLSVMVTDLTQTAESLKEKLLREDDPHKIDWTKVEGWH